MSCGKDSVPSTVGSESPRNIPVQGATNDAPRSRLVPSPAISVPAGRVWGRETSCGRDQSSVMSVEYSEQSLAAFDVDKEAVACDDWYACIETGTCQKQDGELCRFGFARVRYETALAYCAARKSFLPTWGEWLRAVRLDERTETIDDSLCAHPSDHSARGKHCVQEAKTGVRYALLNPASGEWTRDLDCIGSPARRPVLIDLEGLAIGLPDSVTEVGEFRCVSN